MKISKKRQAEIRENLLQAAVELMEELGYERASMRAIARRAGVGDATIYNYFASKEALLLGYIKWRHESAIVAFNAVPEVTSYTLHEGLHLYFELILEQYMPDREFVSGLFNFTQRTFLTHFEEYQAINTLFLEHVRGLLQQAMDSGEIPKQPIDTVIPMLILDGFLMIFLYWVRDRSEGFEKTTELIDISIGIMVSILKEGLISKVMDMGTFFVRQFLFSQFSFLKSGSSLKRFRDELSRFNTDPGAGDE